MTPYEQGQKAFQQGTSSSANPFPRCTQDYDLWKEGWMDERAAERRSQSIDHALHQTRRNISLNIS